MDRTTLLGLMAFAVISSALNKARDGSLAWSTAAMRIRKWNSLPHHNRQVDAVWMTVKASAFDALLSKMTVSAVAGNGGIILSVHWHGLVNMNV
jgi:hypothetical protein